MVIPFGTVSTTTGFSTPVPVMFIVTLYVNELSILKSSPVKSLVKSSDADTGGRALGCCRKGLISGVPTGTGSEVGSVVSMGSGLADGSGVSVVEGPADGSGISVADGPADGSGVSAAGGMTDGSGLSTATGRADVSWVSGVSGFAGSPADNGAAVRSFPAFPT